MKFPLIIATTNAYRKKIISSIVEKNFPEINISKNNVNIKYLAPESNVSAKKNVAEKAKFYQTYFNNNVLCEDNTLVINGKEISPNRNKEKLISKKEVFDYWLGYLKKNGAVNGTIIKAFAICTKNDFLQKSIRLDVGLKLPKVIPSRISLNPLNYFIIPKGHSKFLSEFSTSELVLYRKKETALLKNIIRKMLKNYE